MVRQLLQLNTTNMLLGDGRLVDNPRRPGELAWRDYMKHQTENLGDRQSVETRSS
jgi:hypothetical protein